LDNKVSDIIDARCDHEGHFLSVFTTFDTSIRTPKFSQHFFRFVHTHTQNT